MPDKSIWFLYPLVTSSFSSHCVMQRVWLVSPDLHGQSHSPKIHWHISQMISRLKMTQK